MNTKEKVAIVKSIAEELVTEEELTKLFSKKKNPVAYDGFEPSGQIHIAQGLMRAITVNKLTSTGITFKFLVADWHGYLNNKLGGDLKKIRIAGEYLIEVWKACGMDLKNVEFIWGSEFYRNTPEYWDTVMKLSLNSTIQRVMRCSQIMGREESTSNPASQIFYPLMQAADIIHLGVDIAQLGLDQRKVNMLARDIFPKLKFAPPVVVSHHMLLGLMPPSTDKEGIDRKIAMKMSKSKPDTAIFMTDSSEEVKRKFKKAYCPEGIETDNPVLEYAKYIVFEKFDKVTLKRPDKFGGDVSFTSYEDLREAFVNKKIHPLDLKTTIATYIDAALEPIRKHFKTNAKAKKLLAQVSTFEVTR